MQLTVLLDLLESIETFCLLLSDAAKYVAAADATLKSLYPNLFHVTCVAHLLYNFAIKVKSHLEDVDQLIAKVKSVIVKTKPGKPNSLLLPAHLSLLLQDVKLVKCCPTLFK